MVHLGLRPIFPEVAKIVGTYGYLKSNPKQKWLKMTVFRNMISEKVPYLTGKLNDQETILKMLKTII